MRIQENLNPINRISDCTLKENCFAIKRVNDGQDMVFLQSVKSNLIQKESFIA